MLRSPSPSSTSIRSETTSQAVRPQADSQLEHPSNCFSAGTSEHDVPGSGDQPINPDQDVGPTTISHTPSRVTTGLAVFKGVLEITKEVAEVFTPLKIAVGGLLGILDWVETVGDVREKFESIAEKAFVMTKILEKYQSLPPNSQADMTECANKVAAVIDAAINVVHEKQKRHIIQRIALAPADVDEVERQLRAVGDATPFSVRQIAVLEDLRMLNQSSDAKLDNWIQSYLLDKLSGNASARHDAMHIPCCTKDTRIQLLEEICTWVACNDGEDEPPIFFLDGVAGSGKSTISKTLCASLNNAGCLGASFFCSRRKAEQRDVRFIFPTLAYLLSLYSPAFASEVGKVLRKNPIAASADIEEQFHRLISEPATAAFTAASPVPVVVVDALDECDDADATGDLLKVIVSHGNQLPLKFFVTSRPEPHIRTMFGKPGSRHLRLRDIERGIVDRDIRKYLTAELSGLKDVQPSPEDINILMDRSQGLFIYAATACKYIKANRNVPVPPTKRLQALVSSRANAPTGIDAMYDYILEQALQGLQDDEVEIVLRCLHAVVCARNPLSVPEFAHLLRVTPVEVRCALVALHSVINIPDPEEEQGLLTTYHASFPDYLTKVARSELKRWATDTGATHCDLFLGCKKIMETGLFFNVSGCSTSYASNAEQPSHQVLPPYLVYACRFWIEHLTTSSVSEEQATQLVSAFFGKQFLYWLEVLSVCNHADVASSLVKRLELWLRAQKTERNTESADVSRCLRLLLDAYGFLIRFRTPIVHSAPHVYISALAFTPPDSEIGQAYLGLLKCRLKVDTAQRLISLPLLKIHENAPRTLQQRHHRELAFSADSRYILSAADNDVCRWDARTGESYGQPQQGPDIPHSRIALSPDGTRAVSSSGSAVCVWDTESGRPIVPSLKLPADSATVNLVVFSPDGKRVAAGIRMPEGRDSVICKWDADTGDPIGQPLVLAESGKAYFGTIALAPNGKRIAAGLFNAFGLWDAETGAIVKQKIYNWSISVSIVFSPDSAFVVFGDAMDGIYVWDAKTADTIGHTLGAHRAVVTSLAFSPDGEFIASGWSDNMVRLGSFKHGRHAGRRVLKGHTGSVESVVFSLDGHALASTSDVGDICIWDVAQTMRDTISIGEQPSHIGAVSSVAFSPDGGQVASASEDRTVRVWDAHTGAAVGEPLLGLDHDDRYQPTSAVSFLMDDGKINLVSCYTNGPAGVHREDSSIINVWDMNSESNNSGEWSRRRKDGTYACALSPDGKRIALHLWTKLNIIDILESATGIHIMAIDISAPQEEISAAGPFPISAAFSLYGRFIAVQYKDTFQIWDTNTGACVVPPFKTNSHSSEALIALSPDGKVLAYAFRKFGDARVCIRNLQTHVEQSCMGHTDPVCSLAFSPDGKLVA
ncbi:hypothetical protein EVJ58_g4621 [Rhodofomes roseus]|uniref:Nephrocystin 3-like N-terminal domain-containing protein n=1 Tax=Rhodofomes roseus TaxID=34475 RepID=A0A4Y9YJY9_9APHY|nr:hypothetical protein EVJ58_g4621 [Rhodofomes roseus]